MTHEFELRKNIDLDATPEEVWEAIATGPGMDSWFMGHSEIEPREGGTASLTMAGQTETSTITSWEPGKHFKALVGPGDDGTFMAIEYLIEGRGGSSTVLRLVQSGVMGDDWEAELDAMSTGWDMYLHKLATVLVHFPGQHAVPVTAMRPQVGAATASWQTLTSELGLTEDAAVDEPVRLTVPGLPPIEGVVDYVDRPSVLGVRAHDALYTFLHSGAERGEVLFLTAHLFATDDGPGAERAWQSWVDGLVVGDGDGNSASGA